MIFTRLDVGKLDMTAALPGESDLKFGAGESRLTLIGSRDDYKGDVEKGIGGIAIDGKLLHILEAAETVSTAAANPSITIRQTGKFNLFCKDSMAQLTVKTCK